MTLNQELEAIKDRFSEIEKLMTRLELNENLEKASNFLADHAHIAFYSITASLGQLMDKFIRETQG